MPNRMIKDSIHNSEKVNAMTDFQFRLWISLITYVDDYGRGDARPAIIKGNCFPLRERLTTKDIENALMGLAGIGCVVLYTVDGRPYLCFPNWERHQTIRNKRSKFPAPDECDLQSIESNCNQAYANVPVIQSNPNQSETESESKQEPREDAFDVFWNAYPKKVGKEAARKAFAKVKVPVETLTAAIQRQKGSDQWSRDNGQYIPNPATWLNQGRWEDELAPAGKPQQQKKKFDGASWGNETPEERQKALDNARRIAKMLGAEVKP